MRRLATIALVLAAMPTLAGSPVKPATTINPLLTEWKTPFGVPPFEAIKPEHFVPAFEAAMAAQRKEIDALVGSAEAPTFANTVEALDDSGELLASVGNVFFNLSSAETNDQLQAIAREMAPKLSAFRDDIFLNEKLFARVKAVWDGRDLLRLGPDQGTLLKKTYDGFVRGGANLAPADKERLRAVNAELAGLGVRFGDNLLAQTNAYRLVIDNQADLAGLPTSVVAAAAETARAAKLDGKWVFTLHSPSIWPFLQSASNRELRRQILDAYTTRANHDDGQDNKSVASKIAALRAAKAGILGYRTWADLVLDDSMAKTPERVYGLLTQLWPPALARARQEAADLQAQIKAEGQDFTLEAWDWGYYTEKVRKARYDLDEEEFKPYFSLDNVRQGAFWLAGKLYGLQFVERHDIPKYHPEVRTFEVKDADGSLVGILLVDYHPRPGKRGGAWMNNYRDQWIRNGKDIRPIIGNVGNFTRPTGDLPALLTIDEVETLFHEFGHALHGLVSKCRYRSLSGANVARDFVELPSQIMENWVLEPEVLKVYAKHYKTGQVIPPALVEKLNKAKQFNQGFATTEYLAACFLDLDWHTLLAPSEVNSAAFEKLSLARMGLMPEIVSRYRTTYFNHIFGGDGGYSAGYYSYVWAEVLDADAFQAFKERGIFDQATARAFRSDILERGASEDPMELYKRFRGREPSVEPLLAKRGLK
ncbi:MAG TPA: M3 family metallopeptidase [Thermoanaerobaculaceae bacterium]|nr:M3 family metallopeptidase [Thermoanaerobaculaceae bacterium]HPS77010.1 M3 family metallopeptidase [Thermoanaerobaculaceae bacterium]